jgi:hypothetical protein
VVLVWTGVLLDHGEKRNANKFSIVRPLEQDLFGSSRSR